MKNNLPFDNFFVLPVLLTRHPARRWRALGLGLLLVLLLGIRVQAAVIYTVGASGTYPTIGAALAAVPSPLTQAYELHLLDAAYTESVTLDKTGTAANTLTLRPAPGVASVVITGTLTFGAGSSYATVSGHNGTVARTLTLRQSSTSAPTVRFGGDASDNTVREAVVLGANTLLAGGVVEVGAGAGAGNDRNTITLSHVGNASPSPLPANLVYAATAGTGVNDRFTLTDSQLYNFTTTGVLVGAGNGDAWNISRNSLYYNAAAVPTTAQTGIRFAPGAGANDVLLSGNYIGGRAAGATGGIWTNAGTQNFFGIVISCSSSTVLTNEVTGNTVSEVGLNGTGPAALTALSVDAGRAELTGNALTNLTNTGPVAQGVNSLVSKATTILTAFTVGNDQLMLVESGSTLVLGDLTNAGILTLAGGDIRINGNFTNSGTLAQTNGVLEIKGDMLNTGAFSSTTGLVKLTGAGNQKVSGGLYFNLEVSGGGTKTFTDDAEVFAGVQMNGGVLATSSVLGDFRLKLGAQATLAETDASYVLGRVEVRRTPALGLSENFGGVGLELLPAPASPLPGSTLVTRVTGTAPVGAGGRQGILRYFDITAPVSTGLNVAMTFGYFTHELNGIPVANLRFFKSVNAGGTWQNMGRSADGPAPGGGYAVLNNVGGFSRWTLGNLTNPLPVGLTAFRAERQGRHALLTWATATELDNAGFGLEVSTDGKAFRQIGYVAAEGTGSSTMARSYRFVATAEAPAGRRYYRLRQDDRNGPSSYYGPQVLDFDAAPAALAAYPTRFGPDLTVALSHPTATAATLRLLDGLGREVWQQALPLAAGAAPQHVQPACPPGTYILTATTPDGQVLRQRVVRE